MIQTIIIEDNLPTLGILKDILEKHFPEQIDLIAEASTVEKGVEAINRLHPKLIFLDIELPDGTGFDILKKVEKHNFKVIFTTAYESYSLQAIKFSAFDYLLKPFDESEIVESISKAIEKISEEEELLKIKALLSNQKQEEKQIIIKTSDNIFPINTNDIFYCKSDSNYTEFYLNDGRKIMTSKTLKHFESLLSPFDFLRVHKTYLVNVKYIKKIKKGHNWSLKLWDNTIIPIAVRKKDEVLTMLKKRSNHNDN